MPGIIVVGAQWGDEGKGKVVDLFADEADMVVRFGGGANAGHTLVLRGETLVTHLIPSGVLNPGTQCVLGDGMVIDPETLLTELETCQARGLLKDGELLVSGGAHVTLPFHKLIEGLREDNAERAIGTTRRGIGPTYEAKAGRRGITVRDLLDRERLGKLVAENMRELRALVAAYGGSFDAAAEAKVVEEALAAGERLRPYVGDAGPLVYAALKAGKKVLFEGAQGALLDIDHGTYPFVTSSSTIASGACQGVGIGPTAIDEVIGITKAYATRVGEGPFPTEMSAAEAESWREAGGEFGATTGRPRRCGWLDLPALRRAVRINGVGRLALTKLDILSARGPLKLCTGYRVGEIEFTELPSDPDAVQRAEPIYKEFAGWAEDISACQSLDELPSEARTYIDAISEGCGVPLCLVSIGPGREATITLGSPFGQK